ncbi:MAG: hypothetical protein GF329_20545 [Candidatus Lokiarchaeota archaeon]|nr:hypothetical protein [Candidatus Lokiarchaeota archaeon]
MIHIAFLLHIYQPPCQFYEILKRVVKESYVPFLKIIKKTENVNITLNINGSLTELLELYDYNYFNEMIDLINELSLNNKIRFTGSAKYHPILPLLQLDELERQIKLNEEFNRRIFDKYSEKKGFFPPELCISLNNIDKIYDLGDYHWMIADGIACPENWPTDEYYSYNNMPIFFRDSIISNHIAFNEIKPLDLVKKLENLFEQDYYIIFALDGETFGHHIKNYENDFLKKFFDIVNEKKDLQLIFIDEILDLYPSEKSITPIESSWSTTREDLENEIPYPLWANPANELHVIQDRLQDMVYRIIKMAEKALEKENSENKIKNTLNLARSSLDKGEMSCKLWWSCSDHFDFNMIINANQYLLKAAINGFKAITNIKGNNRLKNNSRRLYENILSEYQILLREIGTHVEYKYRFGHF